MSGAAHYANSFAILKERVRELARKKPDEVLALKSPWDLFKLGLQCGDLDATAAQASYALADVQSELRAAKKAGG